MDLPYNVSYSNSPGMGMIGVSLSEPNTRDKISTSVIITKVYMKTQYKYHTFPNVYS